VTRDEVLQRWESMTPRERDAWVAEAVLGCNVFAERWVSGTRYRCDCGGANSAGPRPHGEGVFGYIKHYTTDMAAAWAVAEKHNLIVFPRMTKPGWCSAPFYQTLGNAMGRGFVEFIMSEGAKRDTAPEAICLAAILAEVEMS